MFLSGALCRTPSRSVGRGPFSPRRVGPGVLPPPSWTVLPSCGQSWRVPALPGLVTVQLARRRAGWEAAGRSVPRLPCALGVV